MAQKRQPSSEPAKPNKFKFVYIEADLSETNFSELTSTIAQVMRPAAPSRQIPNGKKQQQLAAPAAQEEESDEVLEAEYEHSPAAEQAATPPRPPRQKKFKAPNFLNDLDLNGNGITFKDFAEQKNPQSKAMRYLVAMFWLKEHGNNPTANADKIYTCFKKAKWRTDFNDWMQPFYNLVSADDIRKTDTGEFAITTTGEDKVNSGAE